jgi:hypothetical protein
MNNNNNYNMFHLPLSSIAHEQLHELERQIADINLNEHHENGTSYGEISSPPRNCTIYLWENIPPLSQSWMYGRLAIF